MAALVPKRGLATCLELRANHFSGPSFIPAKSYIQCTSSVRLYGALHPNIHQTVLIKKI
jgi:hypothetical protein